MLRLTPLLFLQLLGCTNLIVTNEVYIVPKDYRGAAVVVFDQNGCAPLKFDNGKWLFEVPSSGVLRTSSKPSERGLVHSEYYFDRITESSRITYLEEYPADDLNTVFAAGAADGVSYLEDDSLVYFMFYVGTVEEVRLDAQRMAGMKISDLIGH